MNDDDPVSSSIAALFFALCCFIVITVPAWGPWVDSIGQEQRCGQDVQKPKAVRL
jgi:hypothetical protein